MTHGIHQDGVGDIHLIIPIIEIHGDTVMECLLHMVMDIIHGEAAITDTLPMLMCTILIIPTILMEEGKAGHQGRKTLGSEILELPIILPDLHLPLHPIVPEG